MGEQGEVRLAGTQNGAGDRIHVKASQAVAEARLSDVDIRLIVTMIHKEEMSQKEEMTQRKLHQCIPLTTIIILVCIAIGVFFHVEMGFKLAELCGAALIDCALFGLLD
jgi:hypothetical protein